MSARDQRECGKRRDDNMSAINNDWQEALCEEFKKPYYKKLFQTVTEEYKTHLIFR